MKIVIISLLLFSLLGMVKSAQAPGWEAYVQASLGAIKEICETFDADNCTECAANAYDVVEAIYKFVEMMINFKDLKPEEIMKWVLTEFPKILEEVNSCSEASDIYFAIEEYINKIQKNSKKYLAKLTESLLEEVLQIPADISMIYGDIQNKTYTKLGEDSSKILCRVLVVEF